MLQYAWRPTCLVSFGMNPTYSYMVERYKTLGGNLWGQCPWRVWFVSPISESHTNHELHFSSPILGNHQHHSHGYWLPTLPTSHYSIPPKLFFTTIAIATRFNFKLIHPALGPHPLLPPSPSSNHQWTSTAVPPSSPLLHINIKPKLSWLPSFTATNHCHYFSQKQSRIKITRYLVRTIPML